METPRIVPSLEESGKNAAKSAVGTLVALVHRSVLACSAESLVAEGLRGLSDLVVSPWSIEVCLRLIS
jgi:hypothetical protein